MASLYFKYGTMNSGKTTQLIQANFNYQERGMRTIVFTPQVDNRYGDGVVGARIGLKIDNAVVVRSITNLYTYVQAALEKDPTPIAAVFIDEVQFFNASHVYQMAQIVDEFNIPVLAYGLKVDFKGEMFTGSYHLMCLADKLEEIKSICWCGNKAHMVARVDAEGAVLRDGAQVVIGGNDTYISLCRKHYMAGQLG
jgi:thymidine kinase